MGPPPLPCNGFAEMLLIFLRGIWKKMRHLRVKSFNLKMDLDTRAVKVQAKYKNTELIDDILNNFFHSEMFL